MGSKKKHRKKHYKGKPASVAIDRLAAASAPEATADTAAPVPSAVARQFSHLELIRGDVRRVALLSLAFVVAQLGLWYLFANTGLGAWAYSLIRF